MTGSAGNRNTVPAVARLASALLVPPAAYFLAGGEPLFALAIVLMALGSGLYIALISIWCLLCLMARVAAVPLAIDHLFPAGFFALTLACFACRRLAAPTGEGAAFARRRPAHARRVRSGVFCLGGLILALLAFRSIPLVSTGLCAGALILLALSLEKPPASGPKAMRRHFGSVILVLVSVAASLGVAEFALRFLRPLEEPEIPIFREDSEAFFSLSPGAIHRRVIEEVGFEYEFRISSQGLRDREYGPKAANEFRIALLGDSFAIGHGLHVEDSLSKTLEKLLAEEALGSRISILNFGVPGYSPWQSRIQLKRLGEELEIDMAILQVFPPNDFDGSLEPRGVYLESFSLEWKTYLSDFVHQHEWQLRAERWLRESSALYRFCLDRLGRVDGFVHVLDELRFLPRSRRPAIPPSADRPFWIESQLTQYNPKLRQAWEQFQLDVRGLRDDCRSEGIEFMAFAIPSSESVVDANWSDVMTWYPRLDGLYDRGKDVRLCEAFFFEENIAHVNVMEPLRAHPAPHELYYRQDGHLTKSGALAVSEILVRYFLERYVDSPEPLVARMAP